MKIVKTIIAIIRVFVGVLLQTLCTHPLTLAAKMLRFISSDIVLPKAYTKKATQTSKLQTSWVKPMLQTLEPTSTPPSKLLSIKIRLKILFKKFLATLGIEIN